MIAEKAEPDLPSHSSRLSSGTPPERTLTPAAVASQVQAFGSSLSAPFKQISKLFDIDDTDGETSTSQRSVRGFTSLPRTLNSTEGDSSSNRRSSGIFQAVAGVGSRVSKFSNPDQRQQQTSEQPQPNQRQKQLTPDRTAATQISVEERQAQRIQLKEHKKVVHTLHQMFPNLDVDVINDVVADKQGRVGAAVDACLALSDESDLSKPSAPISAVTIERPLPSVPVSSPREHVHNSLIATEEGEGSELVNLTGNEDITSRIH